MRSSCAVIEFAQQRRHHAWAMEARRLSMIKAHSIVG